MRSESHSPSGPPGTPARRAEQNRRRAWRGLRRTVLWSLVFGVGTTFAVAWILAGVVNLSTVKPITGSGETGVAGEVWVVHVRARSGAASVLSQRFTGRVRSDIAARPLLPSWAPFGVKQPAYEQGATFYESRRASARGWPKLALMAVEEDPYGNGSTLNGGIRIGDRLLPLRVIPLGFAVDVAVYSCAVLIILGPWILRRVGRLRRNECLGCGYPLGGAGRCPECGREVDEPASVPQPLPGPHR
ncbi:MAG: hypothetical protein HKN62_00370 [Phycisphaerales bacterium]|nr:hypothetical protein [Phycisphaerales bacterium]